MITLSSILISILYCAASCNQVLLCTHQIKLTGWKTSFAVTKTNASASNTKKAKRAHDLPVLEMNNVSNLFIQQYVHLGQAWGGSRAYSENTGCNAVNTKWFVRMWESPHLSCALNQGPFHDINVYIDMLHMAPFIFAPTNYDLIKHLIDLNVHPWFEPWMLPVKTRIGHNHYNHLEWPEKERVY